MPDRIYPVGRRRSRFPSPVVPTAGRPHRRSSRSPHAGDARIIGTWYRVPW